MMVKIDFKKYDIIKIVAGYKENRDTLISKFNGIRIIHSMEKTDIGKENFFALNVSEILYINKINKIFIKRDKNV